MSLPNLVILGGSLAIAALVVATFGVLGRALWRSRRTNHPASYFSPSPPLGAVQMTTLVSPAATLFVSVSGAER